MVKPRWDARLRVESRQAVRKKIGGASRVYAGRIGKRTMIELFRKPPPPGMPFRNMTTYRIVVMYGEIKAHMGA
jgi:hypothetical protein